MPDTIPVDPMALRADVREKYREVALHPDGDFHFHTGRPLAALLGYPSEVVDALPDRAVESFAGVGNPFSLRPLQPGEHVVDFGSGGGFDCFVAVSAVGPEGHVVGVDMTPEMLAKSRATAKSLGLERVEFREGLLEHLPVEDEVGRRGDLERGHQPVRRQGGRVRRGLPGPAPRRGTAVRRHRQRQAPARGGRL